MKHHIFRIFQTIILGLFISTNVSAQIDDPVKWSVTATPIDHETYEIQVKAVIKKGYDIYSHDISEDLGPVPTTISFDKNSDIQLLGKLTFTGKKKASFDPIWEADIAKFSQQVIFHQKIKLLKDQVTIKGFYEAQACNEAMCFPPGGDEFLLKLTRKPAPIVSTESPDQSVSNEKDTVAEVIVAESVVLEGGENYESDVAFNWEKTNTTCVEEDNSESGGIWWVFTLGFLGGIIALLTPCVFPMIPLTVSYFTKGGKDKKGGIQQALLYGISIIVIYVLLGLSVTLIFGADALNVMSTSAFFNILFFIIFIVFALSFFGLFEITLPSSWANKTDQLSGKGGFVGIFFMAFTLALVSFSCTGPIIGSLLVQAATDVGPSVGFIKVKPIMGMLGFSIALALPFTLFALFPQWLKGLPKSGGWLEKVKVNLGLLELAFAFKFLSIVDLTRGWGILRWELFMGIWIVIFVISGVYSLGLFSKIKPPKAIRIYGVISLLFALFMLKNTLTYTPVPILSGIAPTTHYNFFNKEVKELSNTKEFQEALSLSKELGKPILLDFTGYGCVNCREMEEKIWVRKDIQELMGKYILTSLYVDDRTPLPEDEQYNSNVTGKLKRIKTIGNKWTDFEIRHFQKASQPFYVIVDAEMNVLTTPIGYSDASAFKKFLQCGVDEFEK
ncbi:MAG TPA: cytochrome c biogenesis protein CcdA [Chitinophagales bacterium]|nr:cytochrome c biogenesis protein CcdA [Chitinophagales bacterium]